ncbi:MAG: sugar-binding domain-containing protein [Chloroflexota bacterium]
MQRQSFNTGWRFYLGEAGNRWDDPDASGWRALDLPHDWSIELARDPGQPSGVSNGFFPTGRGWYRKEFHFSPYWQHKKAFLEFEGVYMNAEIWLNEHLVTRHPYGYTGFVVDLNPYLKYGETNVLRVIVDNASQLNSRWYSGSGIYRPVWMLVSEPIHVAPYGVYVTTPEIGPETAVVQVCTVVQNESDEARTVTLRTAVTAPDGSQAAAVESERQIAAHAQATFEQSMQVVNPRLWGPDSPTRYRLSSEVVVEGQVWDTASTDFGIRSIAFSAEAGFRLNGQPLLLKGGCVHHDNGVLGAQSFPRAEERKVELLKASGFNAIRCAHNPPAQAMLDACDRLGMLVIDEAFDCWRIGKNHYDYHTIFEDWWERDLESMIRRDANHPSIILWSIGNEVLERDGRSGGAAIARMLAEKVRQLDPTRPTTCGMCHVWDKKYAWEATDAVFAALDVGGYNYLWQQYQADHERRPDRIMVGTESFPLEALDNWLAVEENPYVIGDFVWTALDYLGESGIGRTISGDPMQFSLGEYPWHVANCGDIDICGFKRPQSYYRDMVWGSGDKLYIAVHPYCPEGAERRVPTRWGWPDVWPNWNWEGHEGETFQVDVYSACERVELFLNGRSLGTQPASRAERLTASFQVAYEPGELKAVGYQGSSAIAETSIETAGVPAAIRLTPDRARIEAHHPDLCYVTVEVVDAAGRVHPNAVHPIYFTAQGKGEIAAVGNSDPVSTERYRGNQRQAHRGRCLLVVKSTGQGEILLRAQADGLDAAAITIQAV